MSRPKGMRKVNGIWYLPNGTVAPSSAAKANGQVVTLMPPVINATDTVQDKPRHTGIKVHTHAQIAHIENKTGQRFVDNFSDDCGILIPVFMTTDRSEDWVMEHLTKIRKGA